ncbi:hypothetical protein TNCV_4818901 [Trichonephila clavipes]|nr:hypothetical protein TNCV_4818901 [Trichonephila clavipes]
MSWVRVLVPLKVQYVERLLLGSAKCHPRLLTEVQADFVFKTFALSGHEAPSIGNSSKRIGLKALVES